MLAAPAPTRWHHEQRGSAVQGDARPTVERLIREARAAFGAAGVQVSQSRLSRLIRIYRAEHWTDVDFGTWVISYRDPTGETAVRNVMRGAE
ncbi:hypothetical protein BH11ACT1_BH11ACT1_19330 [soil metagenome]